MTTDEMGTDLIDLTPGRDAGVVWVQSDLQLREPGLAREVLARAVDDVAALGEPVDAVWCLGDALVGTDERELEQVAEACIELLEPLNVPICYVLGNHEIDLRRSGTRRYPLYERVVDRPGWHTLATLDRPWFARRCLGCWVVFFGDHADPAGTWWTSHQRIEHGDAHYPHAPNAWARLRDSLADVAEPVMTAGHCAYPGGQRPAELMAHLLPMPDNVRLHLHGHAHIGDMVHNAERPWQRDNPVAGQALRQYNISALETDRTPGSHSAMLRFEAGEPTRLDVRCHLERRWVEGFDLARPAVSGSAASIPR